MNKYLVYFLSSTLMLYSHSAFANTTADSNGDGISYQCTQEYAQVNFSKITSMSFVFNSTTQAITGQTSIFSPFERSSGTDVPSSVDIIGPYSVSAITDISQDHLWDEYVMDINAKYSVYVNSNLNLDGQFQKSNLMEIPPSFEQNSFIYKVNPDNTLSGLVKKGVAAHTASKKQKSLENQSTRKVAAGWIVNEVLKDDKKEEYNLTFAIDRDDILSGRRSIQIQAYLDYKNSVSIDGGYTKKNISNYFVLNCVRSENDDGQESEVVATSPSTGVVNMFDWKKKRNLNRDDVSEFQADWIDMDQPNKNSLLQRHNELIQIAGLASAGVLVSQLKPILRQIPIVGGLVVASGVAISGEKTKPNCIDQSLYVNLESLPADELFLCLRSSQRLTNEMILLMEAY